MKAMILAAGLGTRLKPLTFTMPKPMVPVLNRPLIGWAIEEFLRAGVDEIVINLHHLPQPLEDYVRREYGDRCRFHFSFEQEILGTGGGIRRVRHLLEGGDFFLVNGDTVQMPPYRELMDAKRANDALAALTLRHPPANDRFTPVWFENGAITGFGKGEGEALMFSGSHLISSRIFSFIPDKDFSGIVDEVYMPAMSSAGESVAAVVNDGPWFDVGTPKRLIDAGRGLLELEAAGRVTLPKESELRSTSVVDRRARVSGRLDRSTVGADSDVAGTVVDSMVWERCVIPQDCVVESSIVAHGVELRAGEEFRNVLVCADDPAIPDDFPREGGRIVIPI
jgi:NDP-sugar pyrophosphorylase family protein